MNKYVGTSLPIRTDFDGYVIPFGKHKGARLQDLPASYLLFIADQVWCKKHTTILEYVKRNKRQLEVDAEAEDYETDDDYGGGRSKFYE